LNAKSAKKPLDKKILCWHTKRQSKTFDCQICNHSFSRKTDANKHINTAHKNPHQMFFCTVCEETFENSQALNQHVRQKHHQQQGLG
jgi:uncharacterized C2H2 Zn-finger protein